MRDKLAPMSIHVAHAYDGKGYTITVCPQSHTHQGTDTCCFRHPDETAGHWRCSNDVEIVAVLERLVQATKQEQQEGRGKQS